METHPAMTEGLFDIAPDLGNIMSQMKDTINYIDAHNDQNMIEAQDVHAAADRALEVAAQE